MTTVLHLHLPRSGGSSLYRHLLAPLPPGRRHRFKTLEGLEAALARGGKTSMVSGHFMWGIHRYFEPDFVYFIVLRDPVDRIGSIYDYIRATETHRSHEIYSSRSLLDILETDGACRSQMSNGQVRMIVGEEAMRVPIDRRHFDAAWEHLCRPDVIVTFTDRINEGLQRLTDRIGCQIPPCQDRVNATKRSSMDAETLKLAREMNAWDVHLYERSRERFGSS